mmetsp:Transcript_11613/g.31293  ORF Transcript_11613/g.31293 Transcript_11613/m.31293 type:complete len:89 (+) Transcript_11613:210-476(+)
MSITIATRMKHAKAVSLFTLRLGWGGAGRVVGFVTSVPSLHGFDNSLDGTPPALKQDALPALDDQRGDIYNDFRQERDEDEYDHLILC